jgi:hypothetical protein
LAERQPLPGKPANGEYGGELHGYAADARVDVHNLALDSASERSGGSSGNMLKAGSSVGRMGHVSGANGHRTGYGPNTPSYAQANHSDEPQQLQAKDSGRERPGFAGGHSTANTVFRSTVNQGSGLGTPYGHDAPVKDSYFEDAGKRAPAATGRYPGDQMPQRAPSGGGGVPPRKGRSTPSSSLAPMQVITYLAVVISLVLTANLAHRVCCTAALVLLLQQCSFCQKGIYQPQHTVLGFLI